MKVEIGLTRPIISGKIRLTKRNQPSGIEADGWGVLNRRVRPNRTASVHSGNESTVVTSTLYRKATGHKSRRLRFHYADEVELKCPPDRRVLIPSSGKNPSVQFISVPLDFMNIGRRPSSATTVYEMLILLGGGCTWFAANLHEIARMARYSRSQTIRAVAGLEYNGWLQVARYRPRGSARNDTNEYRLTYPKRPHPWMQKPKSEPPV